MEVGEKGRETVGRRTYSLGVVEGSSHLDLGNDLLALGSETERERGMRVSFEVDASKERRRKEEAQETHYFSWTSSRTC